MISGYVIDVLTCIVIDYVMEIGNNRMLRFKFEGCDECYYLYRNALRTMCVWEECIGVCEKWIIFKV